MTHILMNEVTLRLLTLLGDPGTLNLEIAAPNVIYATRKLSRLPLNADRNQDKQQVTQYFLW